MARPVDNPELPRIAQILPVETAYQVMRDRRRTRLRRNSSAQRATRPADDRIGVDPAAAGRLAGVCGGLPLALQITAPLLGADPALTG
jgi:hypothetical protein